MHGVISLPDALSCDKQMKTTRNGSNNKHLTYNNRITTLEVLYIELIGQIVALYKVDDHHWFIKLPGTWVWYPTDFESAYP